MPRADARSEGLEALASSVRNCRHCLDLPLGPKPILQIGAGARILIAGQAPGRRAHAAGIPFDDPSGDTLRGWLGVTRESFYDSNQFAILPMGLCYPGRLGDGDAPPRKDCAAIWRQEILGALPDIELTVVLGRYAIDWHLPQFKPLSITQIAAAWESMAPAIYPLPHPSPRNIGWRHRNRWFEAELVPALQKRVRHILRAR